MRSGTTPTTVRPEVLEGRTSNRWALWLAVALAGALAAAACAPNAGALVASGDQYAARRQYREAVIQYRKALEREPRNGNAHFGLARAAERLGDHAVALREYVRAADLLPGSDEAQLKAGRALLPAARFEDAGRRAQQVLVRDSSNIEAHIVLGLATAGLRDLDGAVADALEAIRLDPNRARTAAAIPLLQLPKGKPEEGEKLIAWALTREPSSVAARLALANLCWSTDRQAEVEGLLVEALALEPGYEVANRALATFYLSAGRTSEAEKHFKTLAAAATDFRAEFALADYYSFAGRYKDALAVLDPLSVRTDTSPAAWTRTAAIQYTQQKTAEAHRTIDTVIRRDKSNLGALLVKGRFLLTERKPDEGLVWLKAAVAVDPRSAAAQCLLGSAYQATRARDEAIKAYSEAARLNPRLVVAHLQLAQLQLERGDSQAAIESARRAIQTEPRSLPARLLLVRAYLARRDLDLAAGELKTLAEEHPDVADVDVELGRLLQFRQDARGARAAFVRALARDPDSLNALAGLVALDLSGKNVKDAAARVDARLARAPGDASLLMLAARVSASAGDAGRAEQLLLKAIEADNASIEAYGMLGRMYLSQNRLDQARARFEDLVERQPASVPALTMVGLILQAQNRPAEARMRYERVLELDARAPVAANNLAWLYAETGGSLDVALQLAQTAKAALPESPEVNDTLGWIYVKKGMPSLAIVPLQQALEKSPKSPTYHYHLGMAYLNNGDGAKAKASLEEALKLDPNFDGSAEARKALSTM